MAGEVRYCTTSDGVGLAYVMAGAGPFVIVPSNIYSLSQTQGGLLGPLAEILARQFTVVRYDLRGMGLSDRKAMDYSLGTRVADLLAIAGAVRAERFSVVAETYAAAVSIALAASNPERVDKLVLRDPFASGERFYAETKYGQVATATTGITREQWEFISQTIVARGAPKGMSADFIRRRAKDLRAAWEPEGLLAFREAVRRFDLTGVLRDVQSPTLVLRTSDEPAIQGYAREVVSGIPDARLAVAGWSAGRPVFGDEVLQQLAEFLGADLRGIESQEATEKVEAATTAHTMAVVLFTDVVDSTALTERFGDAAFRTASRRLDDAVRMAIRDAGGTPVEGKVLGDGVMGVFTSAVEAIAAARTCVELGRDLPMHIGLHAGDVTHEGGNVYGGAVNIASRVCGLSEPGEILVSATVRELARTSSGVVFEDRGEHALKGIADAVRVFAVVRVRSWWFVVDRE